MWSMTSCSFPNVRNSIIYFFSNSSQNNHLFSTINTCVRLYWSAQKMCKKFGIFCTAVTSHDVFNWTASVLQPHSLSARNLSAEFADNPWTLTSSKAKRKLGFIFKSKQESKTTFCWSVNVRCTAPLVDGKQNSARDVTEWRFCWPYLHTIHRVFPPLSDTNLIIIFSSILL